MYSHEEKKKGGYSFQGKRARDDSTLSPGPGMYYQENNKLQSSNSVSHKIGTSQRLAVINERETLDQPGPGMYSYEEKKKGGFTFSGKKARDDSTIGPGPGGYEKDYKAIKT